jgi:hypothetical protein
MQDMKRAWTVLIALFAIAFLICSIILLNANGQHNANVTSTTYNPYEEGGTWYKGQLHCHSDQSDGDFYQEEVAARYSKGRRERNVGSWAGIWAGIGRVRHSSSYELHQCFPHTVNLNF